MDVFAGLKCGNWCLVEGDKHFIGESTKGGFFLALGERMGRYLTSAELLLIPCPSRGNSTIWSQFGPKLQDLISHYSL